MYERKVISLEKIIFSKFFDFFKKLLVIHEKKIIDICLFSQIYFCKDKLLDIKMITFNDFTYNFWYNL